MAAWRSNTRRSIKFLFRQSATTAIKTVDRRHAHTRHPSTPTSTSCIIRGDKPAVPAHPSPSLPRLHLHPPTNVLSAFLARQKTQNNFSNTLHNVNVVAFFLFRDESPPPRCWRKLPSFLPMIDPTDSMRSRSSADAAEPFTIFQTTPSEDQRKFGSRRVQVFDTRPRHLRPLPHLTDTTSFFPPHR